VKKLSTKDIRELKALGPVHPAFLRLVDWYALITENPAYDSFVARQKLLKSWNEEIMSPANQKHFKLKSGDEKASANAMKFIEKQVKYVLDTKELQEQLTAEELNKANKDPRLKADTSLSYPRVFKKPNLAEELPPVDPEELEVSFSTRLKRKTKADSILDEEQTP